MEYSTSKDMVKKAVEEYYPNDDKVLRGTLAWATLGVLIGDHPQVKEAEIKGTNIYIDFKDDSSLILELKES